MKRLLAGCTFLVLLSASASAEMILTDNFPGLAIKINDHGQGPPEWVDPPGLEIAQNKFRYQGSHSPVHGRWSIEWEITADPDPFLNATFTIVNNTAAAQNFTLNSVLPTSPAITDDILAGGSFSGVLMDSGGGGATLDVLSGGSPPPMYIARIDGADFQALDIASTPIIIGESQTTVFGPSQFGVPIPSARSSVDVLSEIEIETNVRLSGYDTAVLAATFVVEPVPEPSALMLLGMGAVGLLIYLRKRS